MTTVEIIENGNAIALASGGQMYRFHAIWLRDNSLGPGDTRRPAMVNV